MLKFNLDRKTDGKGRDYLFGQIQVKNYNPIYRDQPILYHRELTNEWKFVGYVDNNGKIDATAIYFDNQNAIKFISRDRKIKDIFKVNSLTKNNNYSSNNTIKMSRKPILIITNNTNTLLNFFVNGVKVISNLSRGDTNQFEYEEGETIIYFEEPGFLSNTKGNSVKVNIKNGKVYELEAKDVEDFYEQRINCL